MREATTAWETRGAWAGVARAGAFGREGAPGVVARLQDGFGLATLIVAPGGEAALSHALRARLGLALPEGARRVADADHALIWSGPGQWLLRAARREGFAQTLAALAPVAAVNDQSCAKAALRLSGPHVRDLLCRGVMIDLDPRAFAVGAVAMTLVSHVAIHLVRVEDEAGEAVFEMLIPRSYAASLWSWLAASAAPFGCRIEEA